MNPFTSSRERTRFLRFAVVGAIGSVVDFSVFNLFSAGLGLEPQVAQAISFTAAVTSNFILNYYWTFPDSRSKKLHAQVAQYILVNFIGLLIRTPVFIAASRLFEPLLIGRPLPLDPEQLAHNLALATAIGVVLLWNYFVNRKWTFGDVE